jgi:hypothetical protein
MAKVIRNPEYTAEAGGDEDDEDGRISPSFTYCRTADCIPSQPTTRSYGPEVDPSSNSHIIPSPPSDDDDDDDDAYDTPVRRLPKVTPRP